MNPNIAHQLIVTINRSAELIMSSLKEVQSHTSEFMKYCHEEDSKESVKKTGEAKVNRDFQGKKEEGKAKGDGHPKNNPHMPFQREQGQKTPNKTPEKPNINDISIEKSSSNQNSTKPSKLPPREETVLPSHNDNAKKSPLPIPIPMKPKCPISTFLRFNRAHLDTVRMNYPRISQTDLVTVTGLMWKQLAPLEKLKYEEEFRRDKERYDAEMIQYQRKHPNERRSKAHFQKLKTARTKN